MMLVCLHGGWFMGTCFNSVAQLRAPTGAHLATTTGMLQA